MALDTYAHVFEEFDPSERFNAAERIRKAREELRFRGVSRRSSTSHDRDPTRTRSCGTPRASCCAGTSARPKTACALQPRDPEMLVALGRYRFLTTVQIAELWWPGRALHAVRRRLTRLFEAGFVERFRPQTLRGSYQWTYCLARDGHRAAQQTGELAAEPKFAPRREPIFDYRYVVHDLRTNDWVLRYRELLGERYSTGPAPTSRASSHPRRAGTRRT